MLGTVTQLMALFLKFNHIYQVVVTCTPAGVANTVFLVSFNHNSDEHALIG